LHVRSHPFAKRAEMKALRIGANGALAIDDVPMPVPKAGEVLVRIRAAGLNRADVAQRLGKYPAPPDAPADIPGLEFAGVLETGSSTRLAVGQRVFGLCGGGAQAEYIAIAEQLVLPAPAGLSDIQAAAVPEAFVTAHDALFTQASLRRGERLLVHAAASGVGLAALALAKSAGCAVFGTSRSPEKLQRIRAMGIDLAVGPDRFDAEIRRATGGAGMDVVLDPVGGAYFERNLEVLATRGRLVILSTMGGAVAQLPLRLLMSKRLHLIGTTLRNRSLPEKAAPVQAFARDVLPLLASGAVAPVVDAIYPLERAPEAYEAMQSNRTFGKVVFTL
jgi:putative PIG3 family NAD(P)H quinone oxidoreductase